MIGYLKVDGAGGQATEAGHDGWIKAVSFNHTVQRPVSSSAGSVRSTDRATLGDFVVVKELDLSTAPLYKLVAQGKVIPNVHFDVTTSVDGESGEKTVMHVEMTDVIISNFSMNGSLAANHHPTESVAFNFKTILFKYKDPIKNKNSEGGWDVEKNVQK